ncbi:MAG: hypothetical protein AB7Q37_07100 [Pyrinomonadaceae bacterium]
MATVEKKPSVWRLLLLPLLIGALGAVTNGQEVGPELSRTDERRKTLGLPAPENPGQDSAVKILEKPKAKYPRQGGGTVCIQGSVRLKIEFLAKGEIGRIIPVTRLPYGATENAIEAARKIKFVPAVLSGRFVTTFRTVEFSFSYY